MTSCAARQWNGRDRRAGWRPDGTARRRAGRCGWRSCMSYWLGRRAAGPEPGTVTADAMARAGGYLDYLAAMLDRVTAGLAIGRAEADDAVIARHIFANRPAALNERALYQRPGWAWLRSREGRADALRVLADAGWIRPAAVQPGTGRPRGDWVVSPRLWEAAP